MPLQSLVYNIRLGRLFKKQYKNAEFYDSLLAESIRMNEGKDAYRSIIDERAHEDNLIQYDIDLITTSHLLQRARRLMISLPELDDATKYWKEDDGWKSRSTLSREGIKYLRSQIRAELKERRESSSHWFALMIGLIGATTGLLAIILK